MKKSKIVKLGLLTAIATAVLACDNNPQTYSQCVDAMGNVVAENQCTGHYPGFVWYYSPSPFYYGSHVYGGGYVSHSTHITNVYRTTNNTGLGNSSNRSNVASPSISRGGFGSTGSSSGSSGS